MALLVGPTGGRHAYERDRRNADGDRAEVAAKLPDNLIPQWYAYYIFKNYVELIFFFFFFYKYFTPHKARFLDADTDNFS